MVKEIMNFIREMDPEVGAGVIAEYERQQNNIELIASENIVSTAAMVTMGTVLANKYAEGYPGKRYYGGCQEVDVLENIAKLLKEKETVTGAQIRALVSRVSLEDVLNNNIDLEKYY